MTFWTSLIALIVSVVVRLIITIAHNKTNARLWSELSMLVDCVIAGCAVWIFFNYILWGG